MKEKYKDILTHGARSVFHNKKFVILLWCTNAAFAFITTMPLYYMLVDNLSNSLISDSLASNFDYIWYLQFRFLYASDLNQLPLTIYSVVGIYILIQTFFLGGLIAVFHTPKKNHFVDFFYGGVKYWFRFTKVLLLSMVFYALAFLVNDLLGDLITIIFRSTENIWWDAVLRSLRYLILIFLIGIVTLISDYTKVSLAVNDRIKVTREIVKTLEFLKEHFTIIFVLFLTISLFGALGAVGYNIIGSVIPRTPFYYLFLSFGLQQLLILFRLFIRMYFVSTEVMLYKDISAEVIKVET